MPNVDTSSILGTGIIGNDIIQNQNIIPYINSRSSI